jgi:ribosomal protein S27E
VPARAASGAELSHVYCPECGFQNPETANYCARCGALLVKDDSGVDTTMTFTPEEGELEPAAALEEAGVKGPALVVRSGGGRIGETFHPEGERTTIGRSPDCGIFLDDVTVSRRHAVLLERDGAHVIEDLGSLNGTYVNRRRIDSAELSDGDEVQIGKYRLTFMSR